MALQGLCLHLSANGLPSTVTSYPEDDTSDPLTVDARLTIAGIPFAADHARVQYDNRRIPAERAARDFLLPRLNEISRRIGCGLHVQMYAPRWDRGFPRPTGLYEEVLSLASQAADRRKTLQRGDIRVVIGVGDAGNASISFAAEDDPLVEHQLELGLVAVLNAKLAGQLLRAKESGVQVLLLLDQVQERDGDGTLWLPVSGTVRLVVERVIDGHPRIVDQVWLRSPNGTYARLHPARSLLN